MRLFGALSLFQVSSFGCFMSGNPLNLLQVHNLEGLSVFKWKSGEGGNKTKQSDEPAGAERNRKCGLAPLHEIKNFDRIQERKSVRRCGFVQGLKGRK